MIEIADIRLPLDAFASSDPASVKAGALERALEKAVGLSATRLSCIRILKRSVDARKRNDVHFVATLGIELDDRPNEVRLAARLAAKGIHARVFEERETLEIPDLSALADKSSFVRPVVVGTGPAGLFCALYLSRAGLRPLVIERGAPLDERVAAVDAFAAGGPLDPEANIQFGEGGAGTFSDGKLTTNTKNPLIRSVLSLFVEAGAPEDILIIAKPHIGTDLLREVVRNMRESSVAQGGDVLFRTRLEGLSIDGAGRLQGISTSAGDFAARRLALATGHSARDSFEMLRRLGIEMERKAFSIGVRIEHLQSAIDRSQYGAAAGHPALGPADYKMAVHLPSGRGVYTFCMCPGGEVVCAASEEGGVVVNGMSRHARDGANANAALLVGVEPSDFERFGGSGPLAGIELQRSVERAAFSCAVSAGGAPYAAPAMRVGDLLGRHRPVKSTDIVEPSYARGVAWTDIREVLPQFAVDSLIDALPLMDRKLKGFADPFAVMTGVESRSSSPVRVIRGKSLQSPSCVGLYPCGEGAGYAGGIMSAAVDGLRVAMAIVESYRDGDAAL